MATTPSNAKHASTSEIVVVVAWKSSRAATGKAVSRQAISDPPTKETVSVVAPLLVMSASHILRAGFVGRLRSMTASPTWRELRWAGGVAGNASEAQTAHKRARAARNNPGALYASIS